MWLSDSQKIGAAFLTGGISFLLLGLLFFFDRSLLAMGNILSLIGITLFLGVSKTALFFADRKKIQGTAAFVVGVGLILFRWPLVGFVIECYGIAVLFGGYIGTVVGVVRNVPVVGPYIGMAADRIPFLGTGETLPV